MKNNFLIHAWQINCYVKLNQKFRTELLQLIKYQYFSFNNLAKQTDLSRKTISAICYGSFTNTSNLFKLTNLLKLEGGYVEKQIEYLRDSKTGAYNRTYEFRFPFKITPIVIRIISHLIGDGTVYPDSVKYGQKNVLFMKRLVETVITSEKELNVLNHYKESEFSHQVIAIPMILAKSVCSILNISLEDLKSYLFLEKIRNLPKDYRIQTLAALFVDEGNIQSKAIRMKDKSIIESIAKLIDSLGYERGNIFEDYRTKDCFGKLYTAKMHGIQLHAYGIKKFAEDILSCIKRYKNPLLNLWQKQNALEKRIITHNYKKIDTDRKATISRERIIRLLERNGVMKRNKISEELNISESSTCYLLKTLLIKNKIVRLERGVYGLNAGA